METERIDIARDIQDDYNINIFFPDRGRLDDIPKLFKSTTELSTNINGFDLQGRKRETYFSTSNTGTQRVVTNTNFLINIRIRKVILATGHGADRNRDVMCRR